MKPAAVLPSIGSAVIWGSYYPLLYIAGSKESFYSTFVPFLIGGVILLAYAIARGNIQYELKKISWLTILIISVLVYAMQESIVLSTVYNGSVDTSLFIMMGDIVVVPLIGILLYIDRSKRNNIMFISSIIILAAGGDLVITNGFYLPSLSLSIAIGFTAMILMSVYFITVQKTIGSSLNISLLGITFLFAAIFSSLSIPFYPSLEITPVDLAILIVIGITSFFIAYLLYFYSSTRLGISTTSVIQALIPTFTVFFMFFLDVKIGIIEAAGIAVTVGGATLTAFSYIG